jgi:hypothetical protein
VHVNQNFTQTITVQCDDPDALVTMIKGWDLQQATTDVMGYMGSRVLSDRECLGRYMVVIDFGVVDPDVTAAEEALRNNKRPETRAFAAKVAELFEGPPLYHHYDEIYRTDH